MVELTIRIGGHFDNSVPEGRYVSFNVTGTQISQGNLARNRIGVPSVVNELFDGDASLFFDLISTILKTTDNNFVGVAIFRINGLEGVSGISCKIERLETVEI